MKSEMLQLKRVHGYDPIITEERRKEIDKDMAEIRQTLYESAIYRQTHRRQY